MGGRGVKKPSQNNADYRKISPRTPQIDTQTTTKSVTATDKTVHKTRNKTRRTPDASHAEAAA